MSNSSRKEKLNYNDIRDLILSEEILRRELGETSGSALNTKARGRSIEKPPNRNRSKSKHRSKSRTGKGRSCWNCGKNGHLKGDCPTLNKNKGDQNQKSANAATEEIYDASILSIDSPLESWILYSRASFHSTSQREIMDNYIGSNFGKVYLADDEPLKIMGKRM